MKVIISNQCGDNMGWLGLDDTDHLGGGCTTYSLFELVKNLPEQYSAGDFRLVRLYPFASKRTRGNAAVAVKIDGENYQELLSFLDLWWKENILPLKGMVTQSDDYHRKQSPTDPGMVWFEEQPNENTYWECVTREVTVGEMPTATKSWGGHGVIGATAAIAWPSRDYTFEAISWRTKKSVENCSDRKVDLVRLAEIDEDPNTFMSRDLRSNSVLISPRGNCPVLFGLRAKTFESAKKGCEFLVESNNTESIEGYVVFQTNQATDDHLGDEMSSVVDSIEIKKRGTVKILCDNGDELMAFAESGDVKILAQWLKSGDKVQYNGMKNEDSTIHLERLQVLSAAPDKHRPKCSECDSTLKSMGKNQLLRCPKCRKKFADQWINIERNPPFSNWVQPPKDSMRHLSKPITW